MTSTVELDGLTINCLPTAGNLEARYTHAKMDRLQMDRKDLIALCAAATGKAHRLYTPISLSSDDSKQLEESYSLTSLISLTEDHFLQYEMLDVFNLVPPVDPGDPTSLDFPL
jgi:hypothetical protein